MTYVKWTLLILVLAVIAAFLHYVLPSRDIVRIVDTEVRLEEQSRDVPDGGTQVYQDDVFYISSVDPDGEVHVYRNEDNFWYFKWDSSNLQAEAANLISTENEPRWVVVRHYGWRVPFFSMYPNAVSMRPAEGPDETLIPWFNVILLVALVLAVLVLRRVVLRAWRRLRGSSA